MSSNAAGLTQAELSALLGAPASQANLNMLLAAGGGGGGGGSPGLSSGGAMAPPPLTSSSSSGVTPEQQGENHAGLGMASLNQNSINNSNILLLLQRQAEEQQKLAQLAALTGLSSTGGLPPTTDNLALLLQQQQQLLQLQALAAMPTAATNRLLGLGGAAGLGFGLGGLGAGGLGDFSSALGGGGGGVVPSNLDLLTMAKLFPGATNPSMLGAATAGPAPSAFADAAAAATASLPAILQDRKRKGRTGTFPQKLHTMLSDLERQDGGASIASFLPHGRAFAIHKPRDFVKHVMPKYFRMSRFSSFQRQLNLYDFQRITEGPDKGAYFHELFVQNRPILSTMMKRNKIKGKGSKNQSLQQTPLLQDSKASGKSDNYGDADDSESSDGDE